MEEMRMERGEEERERKEGSKEFIGRRQVVACKRPN